MTSSLPVDAGRRPLGKALRTYPLTWGANYIRQGEVRFRIWAPDHPALRLRLDGEDYEMSDSGAGWKEFLATGIAPQTPYGFVLADGREIADPASRAQAGGIDGPSLIIDPTSYHWHHFDWPGRPWHETILCEVHIGTFTPAGTFRAAIDRLPQLVESGFTAVELMPLGQFPGQRGWGYDGVLPYAPHHAYGSPDDMKAFVDAAHGLGLSVILDVVYNHFGPRGNHLPLIAAQFFHSERHTPWGRELDFSQQAVRDFFLDNALYWLIEFNLDGLRIDAAQAIVDGADRHVLIELAARVQSECEGRKRHLMLEDNRNLSYFLRAEPARFDAVWNDDFHHVLHVIATGERGGYYAPFAEVPFVKLNRALAGGYVFEADDREPDGQKGLVSALLPPTAFVHFLQNHDQVGNRAFGDRLAARLSAETLSALLSVIMLSPQIPLFFMGDDLGETRPFQFFCDFDGDLAEAVREGRHQEAINFGSIDPGTSSEAAGLADPNDIATFIASTLAWPPEDMPAQRDIRSLFVRLAECRKTYIVPLLAASAGGAGRDRSSGGDVVAVDWSLGGRLLQLRANLAPEPRAMPPIKGDIVHVTGTMPAQDGIGPAYTVVVAIA